MDCNAKCEICGGNAYAKANPSSGTYTFYECDTCGRFKIFPNNYEFSKDFFASFLYYNCKIPSLIADKKYICFLFCTKEKFEEKQKECPNARLITKEEVETWYPRTFSEKIDKILLGFSELSKYDGNAIEMTYEQYCSAFFVKRYKSDGSETTQEERENQINFIENYLLKNKFIKGGIDSSRKISITLLPDGFKRIDELQKKESSNSKNVFVAMSFNSQNDSIRKAIKEAIAQANFSPEFMNEIIHNKQIVPEMLRLIKESKFLIMDISDPNYGAYFEAGYAMGLGKEIIITCKEDIFNKKDYESPLEEKALKPHFDIAQKQILQWKDEKDLAKQLEEWIKYLFTD